MSEPTDIAWPRRRLWLRAALLAGFVATLPFTWREQTPGCGGGPTPGPASDTGWALLTKEPTMLAWIAALLLGSLLLSRALAHARTGLRTLAHFASAFALVFAFLVVHFAATFTLFATVRLFAAAWLGLGCLALAGLEAISRAAGEAAFWLRERARSKAE